MTNLTKRNGRIGHFSRPDDIVDVQVKGEARNTEEHTPYFGYALLLALVLLVLSTVIFYNRSERLLEGAGKLALENRDLKAQVRFLEGKLARYGKLTKK